MRVSWKRGWSWASALLGGVVLPVLLNSCAQQGVPPSPTRVPVSAPASEGLSAGAARNNPDRKTLSSASAPEHRPGLGTGWGERVRSDLHYTGFERAHSKSHGGYASIYYNDRRGVDAMTSWKYAGAGRQKAAGGLVEWGISSGSRTLKNYHGHGRRFVVGKEGQKYSLVVKNLAQSRLEIVLSVDGLDVMDGRPASVKKRGYIVDPGETLRVKGWRTSPHQVASFRFSGVGDSYSNLKHGKTRNVGVIGMAVFTEKGVDPWTWMPREVQRRSSASPFAEAPQHGVR